MIRKVVSISGPYDRGGMSSTEARPFRSSVSYIRTTELNPASHPWTVVFLVSYWSPARTDVMRSVLKPSQCIRPT
jgi:hypothetical protein